METNLRGKTVLITGAAKGIGRATALGFAKEGARIAAVDIDKGDLASLVAEIKAMGGEAASGIGDLSTADGVRSSIAEALKGYGSNIDVLVNNVGSGAVRTFDQLSDEDWDQTLQLNFMSYVRSVRAVLPSMRQRGSGVIINNASDLARQPEPVPNDYSVSKAAVLAFTKGLARSEGPKIRVNAVAPGPIWTPLIPSSFDAEEVAKFGKDTPMGRPGQPNEVAPCFLFLACKDSRYMSGQVLHPNGGEIVNG